MPTSKQSNIDKSDEDNLAAEQSQWKNHSSRKAEPHRDRANLKACQFDDNSCNNYVCRIHTLSVCKQQWKSVNFEIPAQNH